MKKDFKGVYVALLTPFDKNGNVNTAVLRDAIKYNIEKGVKGFYVSGSTAEVFLLSPEERISLYRTCAEAVDGKATLFAHVGAVSTAESIRYARIAEDLGYDAISAVAPFYYKFSFDQIKKHYYDIAESSSLPMIIYNFPGNSGVNLTVGQISEFLNDEKFIGVKHTSSDLFALAQYKKQFPDKYVFNGYDEIFLAGVSMGADGGIGSTYNFMAEKFIEIMKLVSENQIEKAKEIQYEICRIISVLIKFGVTEAEKAVMEQLGLPFGNARAPFSVLDEKQKEIIKREITDRL